MPNIGQFHLRYCEQGHAITSFDRGFRNERCAQCGMKFVDQCPSCDTPLDSHWESPTYVGGKPAQLPPRPPQFCPKCGKPFPWQTKGEHNAKSISQLDPVAVVRNLCDRFHLVVRQLRERHDSRPTLDVSDEYDVQDLFHALLHLHFQDVRPEEYTPSYAGKSSRMDFLLKQESIVVELKMTRSGLGAKELSTQVIEDMQRYKAHPDCQTLICFVYDPTSLIANPRGIESDLNRSEGPLPVLVLIRP